MRLAIALGMCFVFLTPQKLGAQDSPTTPTFDDVMKWANCTEYLPKSEHCKIYFDMTRTALGKVPPPAHVDVSIKPGHDGAIVLDHSSPFVTCTLASTPAALARDTSASITSFLSVIGTLGAVGSNPAAEHRPAVPPRAKPIDDELLALEAHLNGFAAVSDELNQALTVVHDEWKYSYASEAQFNASANRMFAALVRLLAQPTPDQKRLKEIQAEFEKAHSDVDSFKPNPDNDDEKEWLATAKIRVIKAGSALDRLLGFSDAVKTLAQSFNFLLTLSDPSSPGTFNRGPYASKVLPLTAYPQKQVTEAITCKDVVTTSQAFDTITFTAYYEAAPQWDFSAGVLISLLRGRQVGTVSGTLIPPVPPSTTPTAPINLEITSSSRVQFMPAAFFEYHPITFKLPWAKDGASSHPFGYVGTFGLAGGLAVNPNNGNASAEFFEGISLGIQRLSIMFGNHNGRYQDFTGGYYVGQSLPPGTTVTPPTVRHWTNHPAFGITYRIIVR